MTMNLATHHEFSMSKLRQTYDLSDETVIGRGGNGPRSRLDLHLHAVRLMVRG